MAKAIEQTAFNSPTEQQISEPMKNKDLDAALGLTADSVNPDRSTRRLRDRQFELRQAMTGAKTTLHDFPDESSPARRNSSATTSAIIGYKVNENLPATAAPRSTRPMPRPGQAQRRAGSAPSQASWSRAIRFDEDRQNVRGSDAIGDDRRLRAPPENRPALGERGVIHRREAGERRVSS